MKKSESICYSCGLYFSCGYADSVSGLMVPETSCTEYKPWHVSEDLGKAIIEWREVSTKIRKKIVNDLKIIESNPSDMKKGAYLYINLSTSDIAALRNLLDEASK